MCVRVKALRNMQRDVPGRRPDMSRAKKPRAARRRVVDGNGLRVLQRMRRRCVGRGGQLRDAIRDGIADHGRHRVAERGALPPAVHGHLAGSSFIRRREQCGEQLPPGNIGIGVLACHALEQRQRGGRAALPHECRRQSQGGIIAE